MLLELLLLLPLVLLLVLLPLLLLLLLPLKFPLPPPLLLHLPPLLLPPTFPFPCRLCCHFYRRRLRPCFVSKYFRPSELYARNVILKTKGDELSELKSLTDTKGDIHSMHKLVYRDIKDEAIRQEVSSPG